MEARIGLELDFRFKDSRHRFPVGIVGAFRLVALGIGDHRMINVGRRHGRYSGHREGNLIARGR